MLYWDEISFGLHVWVEGATVNDSRRRVSANMERSNLYLKLFKLVFGSVSLLAAENEQMLKVRGRHRMRPQRRRRFPHISTHWKFPRLSPVGSKLPPFPSWKLSLSPGCKFFQSYAPGCKLGWKFPHPPSAHFPRLPLAENSLNPAMSTPLIFPRLCPTLCRLRPWSCLSCI